MTGLHPLRTALRSARTAPTARVSPSALWNARYREPRSERSHHDPERYARRSPPRGGRDGTRSNRSRMLPPAGTTLIPPKRENCGHSARLLPESNLKTEALHDTVTAKHAFPSGRVDCSQCPPARLLVWHGRQEAPVHAKDDMQRQQNDSFLLSDRLPTWPNLTTRSFSKWQHHPPSRQAIRSAQ